MLKLKIVLADTIFEAEGDEAEVKEQVQLFYGIIAVLRSARVASTLPPGGVSH